MWYIGRDKRSVKEYLVHPPQWIGIIFLSLPNDRTIDCGLYKSMRLYEDKLHQITSLHVSKM